MKRLPENRIIQFFKQLPTFITFLKSQNIDTENYISQILNYNKNSRRFLFILSKFEKELKKVINEEIPDLIHEFDLTYSLSPENKICDLESYKTSKIFAMDFGSILTVEALQIKSGDRILDLCCAPGGKLLKICDKLQFLEQNKKKDNEEKGSFGIYGNDISESRLNTAKKIIGKYGFLDKVGFINKNATDLKPEDFGNRLFDKILADVECTHDGSFKHILKYLSNQIKREKLETSVFENNEKNNENLSSEKLELEKQEKIIIKISKKEKKRRIKQKLVSKKSELTRK